jgi:hypothetical protein
VTETKAPSKLAFILSQGGLTGIWRGFLLSEVYTLLVASFFVGIALVEGTNSGGEFLSFLVGAMMYGQVIGVIPSVVIGLIAGLLIASGVIALQERTVGTASKLAAAIAVLLSILVDLLTGTGELGINYGYFIFLGLPALIFALDAARTTRKKLAAVEENFTRGRLSASIVNGLFWGALTLKTVVLIYIFFFTQ